MFFFLISFGSLLFSSPFIILYPCPNVNFHWDTVVLEKCVCMYNPQVHVSLLNK